MKTWKKDRNSIFDSDEEFDVNLISSKKKETLLEENQRL